jgi:hypothetical protein
MRFWLTLNEHIRGEVLHHASRVTADEWSQITGMGEAMEAVGWLKQTTDENGAQRLVFQGFGEHNTSSEERAKTTAAERQKAYRERKKKEAQHSSPDNEALHNSDVTRNVTVVTKSDVDKRREEKNRIDNNTDPHTQRAGAHVQEVMFPDPREYPTLAEVEQWAESTLTPKECAAKWHASHEAKASPWTDNQGKPLTTDKARLRNLFATYATAWKANATKDRTPNGSSYKTPPPDDRGINWRTPSLEDIRKMTPEEKKRISQF